MGEIIQGISVTPPEPKNIENVGKEFFEWAEKYWAFERIVSKGLGNKW